MDGASPHAVVTLRIMDGVGGVCGVAGDRSAARMGAGDTTPLGVVLGAVEALGSEGIVGGEV